MDIRSFHVSDDHTVTLEMAGMPTDADTSNTTITIAGEKQSAPDVVDAEEQTIIFSAGSASQQGAITVTVRSRAGREKVSATSGESYMPLEPDAENEDKAVIRSVYPSTAKPGDALTLRGRNIGNIVDLYIGTMYKIATFTKTETSARFTVPPTVKAGTYPIRFKDGKFSGAVENSSARLEVTAADEG